jgi:hypothetical protein
MSPAIFAPLICLAVAVCACVALFLGSRLFTHHAPSRHLKLCGLTLAAIAALRLAFPENLAISDLLVAGLGLCGGVLIGRHIVSTRVLALCLVLAAGADCASFLFGPTHAAMRQAAGTGVGLPLIADLSISVPIRAHLCSVIGLADLWLFTACAVAMRRFGWPEWAALLVPLSGIVSAVAAALAIGPLPALPFLALAMLAYLGISSRKVRARYEAV